MAHEFETGLFVGQPAWHGLGVLVKEAPSLDDAIVMAGLDWEVRLHSLRLGDGRKVDHRATVRSSDGKILGVVGPGWHPVQNAEAFAWFKPFVDQGLVSLEAAGALKGGRRVWVLAKVLGHASEIAPGDAIEQYVLLAHAHDGTLAIRAGFTAVRVVCQNTLTAAMESEASKLIKIHHTKNCLDALEKVREIMLVAKGEFEATTGQLRQLARKGCDEVTLARYVREVFAPGKGEDDQAAKVVLPKIVPLFHAGRGAELSRGTLWGAFNAVTEFVTHERGKSQDSRLDAQWFGGGAKIASRALEVGLQMAA